MKTFDKHKLYEHNIIIEDEDTINYYKQIDLEYANVEFTFNKNGKLIDIYLGGYY
jgi:hypothetical protein